MNSAFNSTMDRARCLALSEDDQRDLRQFATTYQRRLNKIRAMHHEGDNKGVKRLAGDVFKSFGAKVCMTVGSIRLRPKQTPPTFSQIKERAAKLNAFRPVPEIVTTCFVPKITGGRRHVVTFGWERRALQLGGEDVLGVIFPAAPFDYLAKGNGGVPAAIKHLHKLIKEGGYEYVVTADVENCFGSAIKKKVGELLPLPEKVVNNVLLIQDEVKVEVKPEKAEKPMGQLTPKGSPTTNHLKADEAARRGVPQGSSASGIIIYRAVLGPLLSKLPFADRLVLVGDDVAVPVKDMSEGEAVLKTLKSHYATSPVGLLTIGRQKVSHIKDGVDFAGYRTILKRKWLAAVDPSTGLQHEGPSNEWELRVRPAPSSYKKFEHKAAARYLKFKGGLAGWKQVFLYMKRWMASFSLWKPNYLSKLYLIYTLKAGTWH